MKDILTERIKNINIFIDNGYYCDMNTGKVFNSKDKECGSLQSKGYVVLATTDKSTKKLVRVLAHQFIYYLATGEVVEQIDHKNQIKTDNRIVNLRAFTCSQNQCNAPAKGYYFHKKANKWQAYITYGTTTYLGLFDTEQEAIDARNKAKAVYHNFLD